MKVCKECLMLSTRPRLTFNDDGVCSACQWAKEKRTDVDWGQRQRELENYCNSYRSASGFDVVVPVSGGKDSSTVAYKLKHFYGMNPLCINISLFVLIPN
jgi:predicted PP-loop superfamily ATPase